MKSVIWFLFFSVSALNVTGQATEYFEFSFPSRSIIYSVFDKVEFADSRINQDYIGVTQKGNKPVPVWLHASLANEFKSLIDSTIKDVPKQPHTVLINFRSFFISEQAHSFEFHVECYAKWDNEYWLVYRIDSSYRFRQTGSKEKFYSKVNEVVDHFITEIIHLDLSKSSKTKAVSLDYIRNIDVNEKKILPVYTIRKSEKGVYYSYEEFKNNKPRLTVFRTIKGSNGLKSVLRLATGNKLDKKIPRDSIYAVCDGEDTWIAAPHEYAMLNKRGMDFFFMATGFENNKIEEVALSIVFFNIAAGVFAALPRKAFFEFRLNHINGKFILLRRASDR